MTNIIVPYVAFRFLVYLQMGRSASDLKVMNIRATSVSFTHGGGGPGVVLGRVAAIEEPRGGAKLGSIANRINDAKRDLTPLVMSVYSTAAYTPDDGGNPRVALKTSKFFANGAVYAPMVGANSNHESPLTESLLIFYRDADLYVKDEIFTEAALIHNRGDLPPDVVSMMEAGFPVSKSFYETVTTVGTEGSGVAPSNQKELLSNLDLDAVKEAKKGGVNLP